MEELPSEIITQIYSHVDPYTYREFQQTGKRYKEIGEDPYSLGDITVKDPNGKWITKTNRRGNCLNALTYSEFRQVEEGDLTDGMFKYEFKIN